MKNTAVRTLACALVAVLTGCATGDDWTYRPRTEASDAGDAADVISVTDAPSDATRADGVSADVAGDSAVDGAGDDAVDAPDDAAIDAPTDAPTDATVDVVTDTAGDVAMDAAGDVAMDAAMDVPSEAATDVSVDVATDLAPDACPAGTTRCGDTCATLSTDPTHCGGCGTTCPAVASATSVCLGGACRIVCASGFESCDRSDGNGCEVDVQTDPSHCGACGHACATGAHATATCAAGVCGVACAAGFADCNRVASDGCEVDQRTDARNCGACGRVCAFANAAASCVAGACAPGACNAGFGDCDGVAANGCEANLASASNCRACGVACPAGQACAAGGCTVVCPSGQALCAGACVSTDRDALNCGACGVVCAYPHAAATCATRACAMGSCESGYGDCDASAANGCETDLLATVAHCARCGNACPARPNAAATCTGGSCGFTCAAGYGDCDGNPTNGCETDLRATPGSCGACGRACALPNATAACAAGVCTVASCAAGFGNCDGAPANGCEVDTRADVNNCGSCLRRCTAPQSVGTCVAGSCSYRCFSGWENCDGDPGNGCESSLLAGIVSAGSIPPSCGACGNTCGGARAHCSAGVCSAMENCPYVNGTADCNGNASDLCEANLLHSDANCGACGRVCPSGTGCVWGGCNPLGLVCATGTANCNGDASDGCEARIDNDPYNCGVCGRWCAGAGALLCRNGGCTNVTCPAGTADCNAGVAGCETDINTSSNHCGRCYNQCPSGQRCVAGACVS